MYKQQIMTCQTSQCMACFDAACTKHCKKSLDPARALFALRMKNSTTAAALINRDTCSDCDAPCQSACAHYDQPIRIREIALNLEPATPVHKDLSIDFCGVRCENPFFLSSSVVASGYDMCAKALDMGWAGIVYKTIGFYAPQEVSPRFDCTEEDNRRFVGFKNMEQISEHSVQEDLGILRKLKQNYPEKVIVCSIMGQTEEEWTTLAQMAQNACVDMIECNFSCPHMSAEGLGCDVGQNPALVHRYTAATKRGTTLPILAKMTPNIGQMELPAMAAMEAGATGLAAINTIKSLNSTKALVNGKSAVSGLSGRSVKPIALRFIHDLSNCESLQGVPISGMGGIENAEDAVDFISLGCENLQVTTAVMEYGYRIIDDLKAGLSNLLQEHQCDCVQDLVGSALDRVCPADELDRQTIVYPKFDRQKCKDCKRCYLSCQDAGHQAIEIDKNGHVYLVAGKCVGCHLCKLVCPVSAIGESKRFNKQQ